MIANLARTILASTILYSATVFARQSGMYGITSDGYNAYSGCSTYISSLASFSSDSSDTSIYCSYAPALGTMAECYVDIGNDTSLINYFLKSCAASGLELTLEEFYEQYSNASDYWVEASSSSSSSSSSSKGSHKKRHRGKSSSSASLSYSPIKLNSTLAVEYYRSVKAKADNQSIAYIFGSILIGYWGIIIVLASIFNWTLYYFPNLANIWVAKMWRKHISTPALIKTHKADGRFIWFFHFLIPGRLDSLLIGGWLIIALLSQTIKYTWVWPNASYTSKAVMKGGFIFQRSGFVVMFTLPLLVLFAGRNNIVQFFTRWNFARMLAIHRWVSRVAVILVFIHMVSISVADYINGKYQRINSEDFVRWGYVAMAAGFIILIQGSLWCRRKSYETFYLVHLFMALFFMVGGFKHVAAMGGGLQYFMYAVFALWSFDRFIRICRLASFGVPKALVEIRAMETLKVTVPKPSYWKSSPGQHAFIHFGRWTSFWQSHPFTFVDTGSESNQVIFYIKIKGGITNEIYKYVKSKPDMKAYMRVSVEGPYGSRLPVSRFDNVAFFTGGNGIPGLYSEAMDLLHRHGDALAKQKIKFYWVIRNWKTIDWFEEELARFAGTKVKPIIYVTRPDIFEGCSVISQYYNSSSDSSASETEDTSSGDYEKKSSGYDEKTLSVDKGIDKIAKAYPHIEFRIGRPNIDKLVEQEIEESQGSLAVVSCAHPNMVDDVRAAVAQTPHNNLVEFFDQLQVW